MANTTISELPLSGPITGAEAIPVVQNNVTVQTTAGALFSQGVTNASTITLPFAMYSQNYMGANRFGPPGDSSQNKFAALADGNPGNFLTFQFIGGSINGINIPKNNPLIGSSITLTPTTVTFEDNGFGLVPNQYTDFINLIMEGLNLVSRVVTKEYDVIAPDPNYGGLPYWNQMNYCDADTFFLLFQETGLLPNDSGPSLVLNPQAYGFKSYNNAGGGFNLWGDSGANLNNFENMANFIAATNAPNDYNNGYPFLQQY